jgi:hypothetical protein
MPVIVGLVVAIVLVVVGELVRHGIARAFAIPTGRVARFFVAFRGGKCWERCVAIVSGTVAAYLGVVLVAFLFFITEGVRTPNLECTVQEVRQGLPAFGKLERGDVITAIDGEPLDRSPSSIIDARGGAPVRLTVVRGHATRDITIQPIGHDGHWLVGFVPRLRTARSYDPALAAQHATTYPIARIAELMPPIMGRDEAEPGGPIRIFDIYETEEPGPGARVLRVAMVLGVYILLLIAASDLVRAFFALRSRAVTQKSH